jgi:hypothetical protein
MIYTTSRMEQGYEPVAVVRATGGDVFVEMRNTVLPNEDIEYMEQGLGGQKTKIVEMHYDDGNRVEKANPGNRLYLNLSPQIQNLTVHGIFRRKKL